MQNPYATPNSISGENRSASESPPDLAPRLVRGVLGALLGYLAPFVVLVPMFAMRFGWHPIDEQIEGLVDWHWPISSAGSALLIPNACCMVVFAIAASRRDVRSKPKVRFNRWFSLGAATLIGYATMLLGTFVFDPLPGSWSAEQTNLVQSGFVLLIPALTACYWIVIARNSKSGEPGDEPKSRSRRF